MRARLVIVVLAACAATACGGDDDRGAAGSTAAPASSATVTAAPSDSSPPASSPPASSAPVTPAASTGEDPATTPAVRAVQPEGFARVQATITLADGTPCELCLWLADDDDRRAQGLMHVTDLGAADGMAFTFPEPTTAQFWMGNTPLPLSIAFFDAEGAFVSTADMAPCPAANAACPRYAAAAPYATSVELPLGDMERLGIGPGSHLSLTDLPCT